MQKADAADGDVFKARKQSSVLLHFEFSLIAAKSLRGLELPCPTDDSIEEGKEKQNNCD